MYTQLLPCSTRYNQVCILYDKVNTPIYIVTPCVHNYYPVTQGIQNCIFFKIIIETPGIHKYNPVT